MSRIAKRYLPRREAELLDILYRRGHATAIEAFGDCAGSRSYSTGRTQLRVLEGSPRRVGDGSSGSRDV